MMAPAPLGNRKASLQRQSDRMSIGTRLSTGKVDDQRYVNLAGDYGAQPFNALERSNTAALFAENRTGLMTGRTGIVGALANDAKCDYSDRLPATAIAVASKPIRA